MKETDKTKRTCSLDTTFKCCSTHFLLLITWHKRGFVNNTNSTVLSRHVLNRRFSKLNFISYTTSLFGLESFLDSIQHEGSESLGLARHDRLAYLDKYQTSKAVMVSSEFNSHWRQLYFLLKLLWQFFFTKMFYLQKPRNSLLNSTFRFVSSEHCSFNINAYFSHIFGLSFDLYSRCR